MDELLNLEKRGKLPKFVLFWGGRQPKGCLSQWYPSPFTVDGVRYPTAEHFMMCEKARLFGDEASVRDILSTAQPGRAKALGRKVRGFDEAAWVEHRSDIVRRGSVAKFASDPGLRDFLLSTGSKILVEASPLDRVWGIGYDENAPQAKRPSQWRGLNLLGFALMDARDELRHTRP
ncbi:NADAR family protein [Actinomadura harenae]|uniref:NADAR family protein n=1 Tax=Actinomadura harenae TaxID=2483351 RepID=A0A3M2LRN7_9ACTN|nr:NADAR family protein [Actinomadura harenae]RMI40114.1 NADAR family protein [Actinomadura harenae]